MCVDPNAKPPNTPAVPQPQRDFLTAEELAAVAGSTFSVPPTDDDPWAKDQEVLPNAEC